MISNNVWKLAKKSWRFWTIFDSFTKYHLVDNFEMYLRRIVLNRFVFNEKVITPLSALRYTQHHPKTLQVVISLGRHNLSNKIHEKCLAKFCLVNFLKQASLIKGFASFWLGNLPQRVLDSRIAQRIFRMKVSNLVFQIRPRPIPVLEFCFALAPCIGSNPNLLHKTMRSKIFLCASL